MSLWIDNPLQAPDVGVDLQLSEPSLVMLGPPHEMGWGVYQNPHIWQLRDQRLLVYVAVSEDIRCNPDIDWPAYHFISDDDGETWQPIEPDESMIRESGYILPDGTQIYFDRHLMAAPSKTTCTARMKERDYPGLRLQDLPPEYQQVPMYVRSTGESDWTLKYVHLPAGMKLPVLKIIDRDNLDPATTDKQFCALFNQLQHGDDSVPHLLQINAAFMFRFHQGRHSFISSPIHVHGDGSWLYLLNTIDFDLFHQDDPSTLAVVMRSTDGGEHWQHWRKIPCQSRVVDLGDRAKHWIYRAHMNVMPDNSWVIFTRSCRDKHRSTSNSVMFTMRSTDQGITWSPLVPIRPFSVNPDGLVLPNGIAVRKYGRPGHYLTFCADGSRLNWGNDVELVSSQRPHPEDTCNNNNMIITGDDRITITYSDFGYEDKQGRPRKAIYTRHIIARPR